MYSVVRIEVVALMSSVNNSGEDQNLLKMIGSHVQSYSYRKTSVMKASPLRKLSLGDAP
jgi:hypothetical protein